MWIVGFFIGLGLGGMTGSFELAFIGGIVGAAVAGPAFRALRRRAAQQPDMPLVPYEWGDASSAAVSDLRRQVESLRARVEALERAAVLRVAMPPTAAASVAALQADDAPAPPSSPGRVPVDGEADARSTTAEGVEPASIRNASGDDTPGLAVPAEPWMAFSTPAPDRPDATGAPLAEQAPEPALERESEPEPAPQSHFSSMTAGWASPPPPPPRRPWPERLPAPLRQLIFGGNTLVKLGVLILFLGLAFLLSYTAERVTVPVELRYALVALAGAGLLGLGWFLRKRRRDYGLILQGAGIGVFYLTTLGAMKISQLLPPAIGLAFLFTVAVLSALLAVLQNAPTLAIVAALEGFAAPVLASTGENRPVGLFSYLLVLDIGIFAIAWFKAWRPLNLIGLVGTFTLAAAWARDFYSVDQYGLVQPFLIVFFLLFAVIGLLFARRTLVDAPADEESATSLAERAAATLRRVGRVDSSLVFGAPMAAFGLQYLLVRSFEFGAAFSALTFGAFYLALGRLVFARMPRGLRLLAEAYAVVGVVFATLAIPLGFEGQWTGAAWAIEAAGMYWLGVRQQRPYSRAFAFALVAGAVVQLLGAIALVDGGLARPWLQGSLIGPILLAGGVFAIWLLQRRHRLAEGTGWEAVAGAVLPWIGIAALTLLPWQALPPAAAATVAALMSVATFAVAVRFRLAPLRGPVHALQLLAVLAFVATLQLGTGSGGAIDGGRFGTLEAILIVASLLATTAWSMRAAHLAALATGIAPVWTLMQVVGSLAGVGLLHLALLLPLQLRQVEVVWPVTALAVWWVALRLAQKPLAAMAALLQLAAAGIFVADITIAAVFARTVELPAFANLEFWAPLALGLTALIAGDWLRAEASPAGEPNDATNASASRRRWRNDWCARPVVLWSPVVFGLVWWLFAFVTESRRLLLVTGYREEVTAATVGVLVITSVLASVIAQRRAWRQLALATLATLPAIVLVGAEAVATGLPWKFADATNYLPSSGFGWLAWPVALVWHLRLLRLRESDAPPVSLGAWHIAGLWFFLILASLECHLDFRRLGDDRSAWSLLGWALVPTAVLWALRSPALLARWPLAAHRRAYVDIALAPVAALLFIQCWVANLFSAGEAAPLPYLPLLNPLELADLLMLLAVGLWWRARSAGAWPRASGTVAARTAAITGWALLTGTVLRSSHHYLGVPWEAAALYASWPTQAALSLVWAICGVLAMVAGHSRASRPVWIAGAVLIGIVVLKLFFVEFADRGGLFRIVSFIGVGALLLLVGYFAPVPPAGHPQKEAAA